MGNRIAALTSALCFFCLVLVSSAAWATCRQDTVQIRSALGEHSFSVDLATTPKQRERGLMFVASMPEDTGMLFIYQAQQPELAFWMKNTLIPLDILFFDRRGKLVSVQEQAIPGDLTPLPSFGPAQFVLEINGGLAGKLGLEPGDLIRHPQIPEAIWACD